jgi:hypothetical protein
LRWELTQHAGERGKIYAGFSRKPEKKRSVSKGMSIYEDIIKTDLIEIG